MGFVEIYKPDGTVTKLSGGEVVWTDKAFNCDSCQQLKPVFNSEITSADGISLIQLCEDCKKYPKKAAK